MIKWSFAYQEFIGQYPKAPKINSIIILSSFKNFRRSIVKSATVSFSPLVTDCRPSEIT